MKRSKKLIVLLVAVSMFVSMSLGMIAEAAETGADTVFAEAELMGKKDTCTIKKKKDGKYYYVNTKSKTDKKQGWKKNKDGDYTYYVGGNGNVVAKVTDKKYYKWSDKKFKEVPLKKNSTEEIRGKVFYVNSNRNISKKQGWKTVSGKYKYYVNANGAVSVKITDGVYWKWTKTGWNNRSLSKYKGKIVPIQKKAFYVDKNGKIVREPGWTKKSASSRGYYINAKGAVLYYENANGAYIYKVNNEGKVTKALMKNGWNDKVFVKNGKVQINTTIKIGGYQTIFDKNGKKVELKVEGGKIVRSDTGEAVSKAGNYKVGSGISQKTYTVTASGKVKKYNNGKQEDGNQGNGKDDTQSDHVHWWQYTNIVSSKEHPAETHREYTKIRDAYDEPVYAERAVCKKCGAQFVTADDWGIHSDETNHGNFEYAHVIIGYNHVEAKYDWVEKVDKEAWSEETGIFTCTHCGDTMTCYWSDESGTGRRIAEKSGILVDIYGNPVDYGDGVVTIIAGVPF